MSNKEKAFLDRHGEIGLMSILERWERAHGIKHENPVPFEDRWMAFLQATNQQFISMAA
ncbi:MAG: hypothetical protein WC521_02260 [Bdellovibrionales bacterium]